MAIASIAPKNFEGNINQHSVRIVTGDRKISETLAAYLNLDFVEKLASRRATGGTRPALDYPALRSIPIIFDERITDMFRMARETKQANEQKAQDILNGIDSYLLSELSIEIPEKLENIIDDRKFIRNFCKVSGKRFDPFFHEDYFMKINRAVENSIYDVFYLKDTFRKKEVKGYLPKAEEKIGHNNVVQINSINKWGVINTQNLLKAGDVFSKNQLLAKNDVLIVITGATIGKVGFWKYDESNYYLGGDIIKFATKDNVNPYFVYYYLRSTPAQSEFRRNITGATNGHLSPQDIRNLRIPIPNIDQQNKIASIIHQMHEHALKLIEKSNITFNNSKSKIEQLILDERQDDYIVF